MGESLDSVTAHLRQSVQHSESDVARPFLCRFLGRQNDVTLHALMRPAFEKRQGTKSRSVVHRRCGGRYRELTDAHELEAE